MKIAKFNNLKTIFNLETEKEKKIKKFEEIEKKIKGELFVRNVNNDFSYSIGEKGITIDGEMFYLYLGLEEILSKREIEFMVNVFGKDIKEIEIGLNVFLDQEIDWEISGLWLGEDNIDYVLNWMTEKDVDIFDYSYECDNLISKYKLLYSDLEYLNKILKKIVDNIYNKTEKKFIIYEAEYRGIAQGDWDKIFFIGIGLNDDEKEKLKNYVYEFEDFLNMNKSVFDVYELENNGDDDYIDDLYINELLNNGDNKLKYLGEIEAEYLEEGDEIDKIIIDKIIW